MNLTGKQIIAIVAAVVSALMLATTQLTDIFGASMAKTIVSMASLLNLILNSIIAALSGQASLVQDVRSMPGVDKVLVNDQANPTLAKLATDPNEPKIGATDPATRATLQATAKGA